MKESKTNSSGAGRWQAVGRRTLASVGWPVFAAVIVAMCAGADSGTGDGQRPSAGRREPVRYAIVVTGSDLLEGAYADSHTLFLTRTLRPLGFRCVASISVGDNVADVQRALRFATARAALVIVTGGLGPTDNDITRQAISQFTGIPLREHPEVLARLARRFGVPPDQLRRNLRIQTQVPVRGTYLNNAGGTAVGLVFDAPGSLIVALPGPPGELQSMVRQELVPYLSRRLGTGSSGCSITIRFVGIGQSGIDQAIEEHVPLPDEVTVSSQFEAMRVDFTFALPHDRPEDRRRLETIKRKILEHLGDYVYATDPDTTLEDVVLRQLADRGDTLAVAEAGSGGRLAAGLASADGADRVLAGAYVAASDQRLRRLLQVPDGQWAACKSPSQQAALLAQVAAERAASDWAIAVSEARGGAVEVAVRSPEGRTQTERLRLAAASPQARFRLVTRLLDQLRRMLR